MIYDHDLEMNSSTFELTFFYMILLKYLNKVIRKNITIRSFHFPKQNVNEDASQYKVLCNLRRHF